MTRGREAIPTLALGYNKRMPNNPPAGPDSSSAAISTQEHDAATLPTFLVRQRAGLTELLDSLAMCDRFSFDTEFVGENAYEPRLCLLQVATGDGIWLVDPLAVTDLTPL